MVTKAPLTRDAIVVAAVALADEDGANAPSMRALAQSMDAGAMSLYNHVEDKDDLLEAMLEHVLADRPDLRPSSDEQVPAEDRWRVELAAIAGWLRGVLQAHPWACDRWWDTFPGPNRTGYMEVVLAALRDGGFSRRMAHHGYHALDLHVVGHVTQGVRFTIGLVDPETTMRRFLERTPVEIYPHVIEHVEHHSDPDVDEDDFAFLLGLLLDGLERHR